MNHLDDYLQHLTFERGLSTLTCQNYARDIKLLESLTENVSLDVVQNTHIRRLIGTLHSRGLAVKVSRGHYRHGVDFITI